MKKTLTLVIILFFVLPSFAQKKKCFIRVFEIDSKYQSKEIDCVTFELMHDGIITKEELEEGRQYKIMLAKYQKKLITLGYDFEPNGKISEKFIVAHHKYLRKKKKAERKAKRNKSKP